MVVTGSTVERIERDSEGGVKLLADSEVCEGVKEVEGVCFGVFV